MSRFLNRLQTTVEAKPKYRRRVVEQISKKPMPPAKLVEQNPENITEDYTTEQEKRVRKPSETPSVKIGESNPTEGRYSYIQESLPILLVFSSMKKYSATLEFFKEVENIIGNKSLTERLLGNPPSPQNRGLDSVYAYLISDKVENTIKDKISGLGIPHYMGDMSKNLTKGRPFDGLAFGTELEDSAGSAQAISRALQESFEELRQQETERAGLISALQIDNSIGLKYLRFLNIKNIPRLYYLGGRPSGAGRSGLYYALCNKAEADNFIKEMSEFNHPSAFYSDLFYMSDIDPAFRAVEPQKAYPFNCIILTKNSGFKIDDEFTLPGLDEKITLLEALSRYMTTVVLKRTNKPIGKFVKSMYVLENNVVTLSKDAKKCILWGEVGPLTVNAAEIKEVFGVDKVDLTYSK